MRIVLQVQSGPSEGRKVALGAGRSLRVGRSSLNDITLRGDSAISGRHFEIVTDQRACYLIDAGSTNGTMLNGESVKRAVLRDGDAIAAGHTRFVVQIEGADESVKEVSQATVKVPHAQGVTFVATEMSSGVVCCSGTVSEAEPAEIAAKLLPDWQLFLTVHFNAFGQTIPDFIERPDYLFDWLPPASQPGVSPILLTAAVTESWPQIVADAWSQDAMLMLFSRMETAELLAHLSRLLRRGDARAGEPMLGYCWPSVLVSLLKMGNLIDFSERIMFAVDAILVEDPADAENWHLFGNADLPGRLTEFGWKNDPQPD